ncbi:hypothetical protein TNCV_4237401 [Trichonephila clavipes]|nr:hypothetical protein TNCV_4237401 [Trichonephila clavipes]
MRAARKRPSTRRYTAYGLESVFGNVTENDQMPCEPLPKIAYNILHTNPTPFPYCASKQFCIIRSEAYEFGSKGGSHFSTGLKRESTVTKLKRDPSTYARSLLSQPHRLPFFAQVKFPSPPSRRTAAPIGCRSRESWKSSTVRNASIAARGGPDSLGGHNACAVAQLASTPCREEAPVATPHLRALTTSVCSVHAKSSGGQMSGLPHTMKPVARKRVVRRAIVPAVRPSATSREKRNRCQCELTYHRKGEQ